MERKYIKPWTSAGGRRLEYKFKHIFWPGNTAWGMKKLKATL